ncbi:MAG: HPr family phosphocarrier protein [Verrucomicrobia bacterium]|nr:HPr family phosphocarrier protein [Verrucomicrobiota bacterium]MBV8279802.1 HPr family phosphocarrier protein [Verrucomicrobiota bacterium]
MSGKPRPNSIKVSRKMLVTNPTGLHARPTSELVRCAMRFKSAITLEANGRVCSAISIMDIMTADIRTGAEILITAEGPDADVALDAIQKCLADMDKKGL